MTTQEELLVTGDTFNHYAYSVEHPEWHVEFDNDKDKGAQTRARAGHASTDCGCRTCRAA